MIWGNGLVLIAWSSLFFHGLSPPPPTHAIFGWTARADVHKLPSTCAAAFAGGLLLRLLVLFVFRPAKLQWGLIQQMQLLQKFKNVNKT